MGRSTQRSRVSAGTLLTSNDRSTAVRQASDSWSRKGHGLSREVLPRPMIKADQNWLPGLEQRGLIMMLHPSALACFRSTCTPFCSRTTAHPRQEEMSRQKGTAVTGQRDKQTCTLSPACHGASY